MNGHDGAAGCPEGVDLIGDPDKERAQERRHPDHCRCSVLPLRGPECLDAVADRFHSGQRRTARGECLEQKEHGQWLAALMGGMMHHLHGRHPADDPVGSDPEHHQHREDERVTGQRGEPSAFTHSPEIRQRH